MAVTKMWSVKGGGLEGSLEYITQESKTTWDTLCWLDKNTGALYSNRDLAAMRDVAGFVGQKAEKSELERVLGYALQEAKTGDAYISAINCAVVSARAEMDMVKQQYGKTGSIQCIHAVQSFRPGEITAEDAHRVGVELARRLWGDRFQIVVSTHLDRSHIHNHFVINSVSFADGKRFYRNNASYDLMRVTSDALCREHGLSVIEHPVRGRQPNPDAYVRAGVERPEPAYERIKRDVDDAIRASRSMGEFYSFLRSRGYTFRQGNLKYLSLRPPWAGSSCRIDKWVMKKYGLDYSVEGIRQLIAANSAGELPDAFFAPEDTPQPESGNVSVWTGTPPWTSTNVPSDRDTIPRPLDSVPGERNYGQGGTPQKKEIPRSVFKARTKGIFTSLKKTRLGRRYLYYCYLFGVFPQKGQRPQVNRNELRQMRNMADQTRLLLKNHIDTLEQLSAYRAGKQARVQSLCARRKPLYGRIRRLEGGEAAAVRKQLDDLTAQIKELRREVRLCDSIRNRSVREQQYSERMQLYRQTLLKDTAEQAETALENQKYEEKETRRNEPTTGSIQSDLADHHTLAY